MENDLTIIPVLNKIDLPSADVDRVSIEVMNLLGCKKEDIIPVSAKTGVNVESILDAVLDRMPGPKKLDNDSNFIPVASVVARNETIQAPRSPHSATASFATTDTKSTVK
jgi:translation elongation factor EF-4